MDVESGLCLPGSYREAFVPASLHGGGPQGEVIVVEGQQASTDAALYECRTSPAVRRINDEDYKAVEGGAFNSHMDVALATGDSLEIATHDQHQLTSVPVVPVDGFARYVGVTEAGVVIGGVTSDDTVVGVVECPGTACLNLKVTNIGPSTTAVAVEPTTGTLMRGCANGSIVEGLQGDCGISPLSSRSVRTLAVSASAIVRVDRSGRVCWSSRSRPEACHGLPPSGEPGPVTAVALSADGSRVAVARAGSADGPTPVEVFACGPVERLISADACAFERQSRIFSPGRVVGISLAAADESLTTLSMWENQAVVQRFPLTARSILAASGF
jgi:hypothetical protein